MGLSLKYRPVIEAKSNNYCNWYLSSNYSPRDIIHINQN